MLLDAWDNVYIWVGENARKDEKEQAEALARVGIIHIPDMTEVMLTGELSM